MESLTISSQTLEFLDLIPDLWKVDFPYLINMKLLKIETHKLSSIPDGLGDFLLQNAPSAKKVIIELSEETLIRRMVDALGFPREQNKGGCTY
ncbi:uncharacterized protein LOC127118860 isoform X4 [Lathyrus oleraceus]|uniref:uncharacterized protein LOC127118860 isoform X4 n=2 Tax=Pisum sativum TaxID=3888 RepID=UPI0021D23999|nr:uncharacterized protein LOC127118860 isoform X4 [Pisum sativum]